MSIYFFIWKIIKRGKDAASLLWKFPLLHKYSLTHMYTNAHSLSNLVISQTHGIYLWSAINNYSK